jgi:Heat shock factor binding protein 1
LCSPAQQEIVTVKLVNRLYRQFVSFKQKQRRRQRQRQKAVNQQANIMTSSKAAKHETGASSHAAAESDGELNLFVEEMIDQMVRVVVSTTCCRPQMLMAWQWSNAIITHSRSNVLLFLLCCDGQENRFQILGTTIMKRMEEMSVRMGELEQSIANIMEQAAVSESTTTPSTPVSAIGGKDNGMGGTVHNNSNSNSKPKPSTTTMEI